MIARHFSRAPDYTTTIDTNRKEIISKIIEILQRFNCDLCAACCRNAGIDLSPDEAVEILKLKGSAYFCDKHLVQRLKFMLVLKVEEEVDKWQDLTEQAIRGKAR